MGKPLFLILAIVGVSGCMRQSITNVKQVYLETVDELTLSLDIPLASPQGTYCVSTSNDQYLYIAPRSETVIYRFDINTGEIKDRFDLETDGPAGVEPQFSFTINNDSLIVFPKYASVAYIYDWDNKLFLGKTRIIAKSPCQYSSSSNMKYVSYAMDRNNIYLPIECDVDHSREDEIKTAKKLLQFNLVNQESKLLFSLPESFSEIRPSIYELLLTSYTKDDKELVYNFPTSDSLYVYNIMTEEYSRFIAKSKLKQVRRNNNGDLDDYFRFERSPYYSVIIYSEEWEMYLRFVKYIDAEIWERQRIKSEKDQFLGLLEAERYAVVILDKEFNPIGEQIIDTKELLWPYSYFFFENHLYLQTLNNETEELKFRAFRIKS